MAIVIVCVFCCVKEVEDVCTSRGRCDGGVKEEQGSLG
jgi:hypothetical protein